MKPWNRFLKIYEKPCKLILNEARIPCLHVHPLSEVKNEEDFEGKITEISSRYPLTIKDALRILQAAHRMTAANIFSHKCFLTCEIKVSKYDSSKGLITSATLKVKKSLFENLSSSAFQWCLDHSCVTSVEGMRIHWNSLKLIKKILAVYFKDTVHST